LKIVFGVGAVIVWGLFQLISAAAKKAEEAKRRQQYGRLPADVVTARGGYGGAGPMPPPVPVGQWPQAHANQGKAKGKGRGKAVKRGAGAVGRPMPAPPQVAVAHAAVVEGPKGRAKQAGDVAPANRVGRLLRQPGSMRAAFILNEVLSKPVALREESRG
jgi:hypothetical protein